MLQYLFILILVGWCAANPNPQVILNDGVVEGFELITVNGRKISAFEGIPYAKPPINELRFEPSQPIDAWTGIWKANNLYKCLQYDHFTPPGRDFVIGDEDCLYMNVYTPKGNLKNLDVIVFIHGGGFMWNYGGVYRPDYIMDKDIIYITFNYRVGPLGFLSTEDKVLPGNNGLKDQTLALKWVKNNIKHFGGNPDSITITGMSAGGASVSFHTLSPLSRGLFHKAYAQSGVNLCPWTYMDNARAKAHKVADLIGCPTKNSKDLLKCLKSRSGYQIVKTVEDFQVWLYNPFSPFAPVVDKWSDKPFLSEHPLVMLKKKKMADVPCIFSFVNCEGMYPAADFLADEQYLVDLETRWNELMPHVLDFNDTLPQKSHNKISQLIRKIYLQDKSVNMNSFLNFVEIISDRMFLKDISDFARIYAASIKSPVYSYMFSYVGKNSQADYKSLGKKVDCAAHADDTTYVIPNQINMRSTERDRKMSDMLIDLWVSFAKTGVPSISNVKWTPLSKTYTNAVDYLHIASPEDIKMERDVNLGHREFWDTVPFGENKKLLKSKDEL